MTYTASFRTRAEREIVELARTLSGLSQGAYTRAVLLKEAYTIVQRAQSLQTQEEVTAGVTPETNIIEPVPSAPASESPSSNMVAEQATANDSQG